MPDEETALINPADDDQNDPLYAPAYQKRDPLNVRVLYSLSFLASAVGFAFAVTGYILVVTGHFDRDAKQRRRSGYESNFLGMESVLVLLGVNVCWSTLNLGLAYIGKQNELWPPNMLYDFLFWPTIIGFGALNVIESLLDQQLCNEWSGNDELYQQCDREAFRLLVVEIIAISLGFLIAVIHFTILIARCCAQGRRNDIDRSRMLRLRIREEEDILLQLVERRVQLLREHEELEARNKALPVPPAGVAANASPEASGQSAEEDLIDFEPPESGVSDVVPENGAGSDQPQLT